MTFTKKSQIRIIGKYIMFFKPENDFEPGVKYKIATNPDDPDFYLIGRNKYKVSKAFENINYKIGDIIIT